MRSTFQTKLKSVTQRRKARKIWLCVAASFCLIVAVGTSYILINPAQTQKAEAFCGYEEHKEHEDSCYERVLICDLPETEEEHTHSDACYEEQKTLICAMEETDGHVHTEECYGEEEYLSCMLEETEGHVHGEECYEYSQGLICQEHEHTAECYADVQTLCCVLEEGEEHQHTEECYVTQSTLVCGIESDHVHTDACYGTLATLTCLLEESEAHHHDENCYSTREILTCHQEAVEPHHHDENCYVIETVCTCGMEECIPHHHTDECYQVNYDHLICELPIHEHTLQCFSNPNADVEDASIWVGSFEGAELSGDWNEDVLTIAKTQLGYTESTRNYRVLDDGCTIKGYTRYGAWYGSSYGDWCAMFCSFCMHYAEIDTKLIPLEAACDTWIELLCEEEYDLYHPVHNEKNGPEEWIGLDADLADISEEGNEETTEDEYIPVPGDLIFFDWEEYDMEHLEERDADHVGFVAELIYDENTNELSKIKTIEGNSGNCVQYVTYDRTDYRILGYGRMPENPRPTEQSIESQPASDGAVAVISGHLPQNAQAEIEAVSLTQEEMIAYFGEEKAALMTGFVAYDIRIMVDGKEWQPDETVSVTVKQPEIDLENNDPLGLAHVEDETNTVTDLEVHKDDEHEVSFDADGFSVYILYTSFTVDFYYEGMEYHMDGMESMGLGALFTELNIQANLADVENAAFSNEALLSVEMTEDGDWLLTSLQAFTSDEMLTVTFSDGVVIEIQTTDAVNSVTVEWLADDQTVRITVSGKNAAKKETISLQYSSSDTPNSYVTVVDTYNEKKDKNYTLIGNLVNNGDLISKYYNWRVSSNPAGDSRDLGTIYDILDAISIPADVMANYESSDFQTWLTEEYTGGENYDEPSAPATMSELMTAFDFYITGKTIKRNVWCYHEGDTEPYAKYITLHDATRENANLDDGDVLVLKGNVTETEQTVIQKSITLRSDPAAAEPYKVDFVTTDGYFIYEDFPCDTNPDPAQTDGMTLLKTRDCVTVCPAVFGTELDVVFENVILDGFDACHQNGDIHDYHLLQTIHNVELTLSGVTIQNYNIESGLNSNGAVSLDGRTTYDSASGTYGNRIIFRDGSVMKNCNSYQGDPYSTGGFMVNDACLEMYDAAIENCASRNGPAIVLNSASEVYLHDGALIKECHATEQGGAIRNSGKLYLEEGSVIENCAPQSGSTNLQGGAVYNNAGTVYVSGGSIENNRAASGGGIYNYNGDLYVSGGSMEGNAAADDAKDYGSTSATLGSAIYQHGRMFLSGAPAYEADQDVYLPEGYVITKDGELTNGDKIPVVLEDEPRFRDIFVSRNEEGCVADADDLMRFYVKLSVSATALVDGSNKPLAAVYNENGLDSGEEPSNVLELDVNDILIVSKKWSDAGPHDPVTVYLYKDGVEEPVDQLVLSEANGWSGTFFNLDVSGDTFPYSVEEEAVEDYITTVGVIEHVDGANQNYWVPANDEYIYADTEYVLFGSGMVLSHNGQTLTTSVPSRVTGASLVVDGVTYDNYFMDQVITDDMLWVFSNGVYVRTKPVEGQTQYGLRYSSSTVSLSTSPTAWTYSTDYGNFSHRLSNGSGYLKFDTNAFFTTSGSSATNFTLYQKVEGEQMADHYAVTITNTKIDYASLMVKKEWSDGYANHSGEEVTVRLISSYGEPAREAILNEENNWSYTFEKLIKPAEGEALGYTVDEEEVSGYASFVHGAELIPGSEGTVWVPVTSVTNGKEYLIVSGGYMVRHTGTGASIGAVQVTIGDPVAVNDHTYPSSISNDDVTGADIWTGAVSGSYFTLQNGGYYVRNADTPIGTTGSSLQLSSTINGARLRLNAGAAGDQYFLRVNGQTVGRSRGTAGASNVQFYEKNGDGQPTPDMYSIVIFNQKLSGSAEDEGSGTKMIDYLGDDQTNADTDQTGEDLYRLYLDAIVTTEPIDLLVIADVSNSMRNNNMGSESRYVVLDRILNGTVTSGSVPNNPTNESYAENAERASDGLIYKFLNENPDNRLAVLGFARVSDIRTPGYTESNKRWISQSDIGSTAPKDYFVNVHRSPMANSDTNYINAFVDAENWLINTRNSDHKLVVVFMTDGIPDSLTYNTDPNTSIALSNTTENNTAAGNASTAELVRVCGNNPDMSVYIVGIGDEAASGIGESILDNMAESVGAEFYPAESASLFESSLHTIFDRFRTRVDLIQDELSVYVDFADVMDLKITMKDPPDDTHPNGSNEVVIWDENGATENNVINGKDIVQAVNLSGKKITIEFNDGYILGETKVFTVSYNIRVTEEAKGTMRETGFSETDFSGNMSSSGMPGYYSNENAYVVYTNNDSYYKGEYPHPVVQGSTEPIVPVEPSAVENPDPEDGILVSKQIDYLGDNTDENGDPVSGMDELYRLYVGLETTDHPIDLLLVIDQSESMGYGLDGTAITAGGTSRQQTVLDFLNGEESDHSDGFIKRFLGADEGNALAILTFGSDCSYEERYVRKWNDTEYSVTLDAPEGAANYTAAYDIASDVFAERASSDNQKVMIFLSDGAPTIAYADGGLYHSFTDGDAVGSGQEHSDKTMLGLITDYMDAAYQELTVSGASDARAQWWQESLSPDGFVPLQDDSGNPYIDAKAFVSLTTPLTSVSSLDQDSDFPVEYDFTAAKVNVPGVYYPLGAFEDDGSVFMNWYETQWSQWDDVLRLQWIKFNASMNAKYDLFWLTESAFAEFRDENEDVVVYTISCSSAEPAELGADERSEMEVLEFMACDSDRYIPCGDAEDLESAFYDIVLRSDIHMTDTLSDYVNFPNNWNLEITLTDEAYSNTETYPDYPYLYREGDFTDLGRLLLDVNATKVNKQAKTVDVVFKQGLYFGADLKVEAAFNVELADKAYADWVENGGNYGGDNAVKGDEGQNGEPITDRDADHITSSGLEGFYSNDSDGSKVTWSRSGSYEEYFPKPVVQLPKSRSVRLQKVDAEEPNSLLAGAEFDVYLELDSQTADCTIYTDEEGVEHYLEKVNDTPVISRIDGAVTVPGLTVGHYYLFENVAPRGYHLLDRPVEFDLEEAGSITSTDENIVTYNNDPFRMGVKNTSGYVIPNTGGMGVHLIMICGALMMLIALGGCVCRRFGKRSGRRFE